MVTIIAKNQTGSEIRLNDLGGARIAASGQYELTLARSLNEIYESADLVTEIDAGNIILNNGTADLSLADSKDFVQPFNTQNPVQKTCYESPDTTAWSLSVDDSGTLETNIT